MKTSKSKGIFRPFEGLKALLESKSVELKRSVLQPSSKSSDSDADPEKDLAVFEEAMADVKRISRQNCIEKTALEQQPPGSEANQESETLLQLEKLIRDGTGFVVADTPEYIEGIGYNMDQEVAKRLHRGEFSIQEHIDLHGLSVENARAAFEKFLTMSISTGKRTVLIIHGRGLSSPAEPILKTKVYEWLTTGRWRKWVMAFTSARLCDGGAGATYVLLRQRPVTKRYKKRKSRHPKD